MSAELTSTDSMFSVRQVPWHGLGLTLDHYPTREEAQAIAHPWEPITEPVYRREFDADLTEHYEKIEGSVEVRRSDNGQHLGVVGDGYEPVKNQTMYDIAEALEGAGQGEVAIETAGSLKGGKKVWLLVRLREPLTIKGDPNGETVPFFALQNAHDGSGAFRGQATLYRIVCANTAQAADMDADQRGTSFTFKHTKNVGDRIEEARQALAGWRESVRQYRLMAEHLTATKVTPEQVRDFEEQFFPMPMSHTASQRVIGNVERARSKWRDYLNSPTCEGIENTAQGLVAASIEYLDWGRKANTEESRFNRAMLNQDVMVSDAVDLAREVAKV